MFAGLITYPRMIMLCAAVFFGGFIDSIAGGGGCISLPAYLLTGLPPQTAFACNKTSSFIGLSMSAFNYLRSGAVDVKTTAAAAASGMAAAWGASFIVLALPADVFQKLLICVLPFVAVFLLIKRDFGGEDRHSTLSTARVMLYAVLVGAGIGLYDGVIGPGAGTFAIMAFATVLRFDLRRASGSAKMLNWATNFGSTISFAVSGITVWRIALIAAAFSIAGHYLGSSLAIKKGAPFIRVMMGVAVFILLAKLAADVFF
jgi:uncharacterized membrane protein YfcA